MPKGKAKSKYNYETDYCEYENQSWCELPKGMRCEDCIRLPDGSKACEAKL